MSVDKAKVLKNAQKYTQKGQYDRAIAEYLKLIDADPSEKTYKNFLGDLYLKQGNQDAAIRAFMDAAALYQTEGFTPHTIALYKKILRIDPQRMEIYQDLGKLYAEQGLVGDAISNFKIAADHYFSRGQKQQALKIYKSIVDLDPKNLNVKLRLAELYTKEGMRGEAASQFCGVAEKLAGAGQPDEAFNYYSKARELQPDNTDALRGLAALCVAQEKMAEAISTMESLRGLEPRDLQNLLQLARVYVKVRRIDQAIDIFEKAVNLDPAQVSVHETLGRLCLERGDRTRAWNHFLPVIDSALNQGNRQKTGRLLEELAPQLGSEKGFLQKQYEYAVQVGDSSKRLSLGKQLAAQFEELKAPESALPIYKDLASLAPHDRQVSERLRALTATVEPPGPRPPTTGDTLEIDLDQIDLSDLKDLDVESLDNIDLPLELGSLDVDMGSTGTAPAISPGSRNPAAAPAPVDVDLSGLDLGEGFGFEAPRQPAAPSQQPQNRARDPFDELDLGELELSLDPSPAPPARSAPPVPPPAPAEMDFGGFSLDLDFSMDEQSAPAAPPASVRDARPKPVPVPPPHLEPVSLEDFAGSVDEALAEDDLVLAERELPRPQALAPMELALDLDAPLDDLEADRSAGQRPQARSRNLAALDQLHRAASSADRPRPDKGRTPAGLQQPESVQHPGPSPRRPAASNPPAGRGAAERPPRAPNREDSGRFELPSAAPAREDSGSFELPFELLPAASPDEHGARDQSLELSSGPRASGELDLDLDLGMPVRQQPAADRERTIQLPATPRPPAAGAPPAGLDLSFDLDVLAPAPQPKSAPRPPRAPEAASGSPTDILDISTDFFMQKEVEESEDLIDLGDLILGDQPAAADDEENVNELLRQLRDGIDAQVSREDYDTHYNLGIAYKEMGLLDEAVDEFKHAAGDPARRVSCMSNIGLCFLQKGLVDQAIAEFRKGLVDPDCSDDDRLGLYYELGLAYELQGEKPRAAEAYRQAARIDPSFRDVREKLRQGPETDGGSAKNRVSFL
jgi:pilus assembly protein FimV